MQVLVTDPIEEAGLELLRAAGHNVRVEPDLSQEELLEAISDAHALIVRSATVVTDEVLAAGDDLMMIGRAGIGVDNIDIEAATERGVIVANAPAANARSAAEHTVAMALAAARSIPQAHMRLKDGEWAKADYIGMQLSGATLGVVGLGRVGYDVAQHLGELGMDVVIYDPYVPRERATRLGAELVDLTTCLERADILTIHTPLTDETAGFIGSDELATLGNAYLINCARGGIVDEDALAAVVAEGELRGAALDVFAEEPLPADSPLLAVDDIIVTPHLGASTKAAQEEVATSIAQQVIAGLAGQPVEEAINAPSVEAHVFERISPYIELAETAGMIATQLFDGRLESLQIEYIGEIADEDVELVTATAVTGVCNALDWNVNPVNARRIAEERGIDVTESRRTRSEDFTSLLRLTVGNEGDSLAVEGTMFTEGEPRIVRIAGYRVDAVPHGHMLIVRNQDRPGVIGLIGTILGEQDINIAAMFNSRRADGGEALTVYNLDQAVPPAVIDELESDYRIINARYITLA